MAKPGSKKMSVDVPLIDNFDLNRYLGTWYEIARLDHRFERGLDFVTAHYEVRNKGGISVLNRGFLSTKGVWRAANGRAVGTDVKNYLKVYFFPLIPAKYRVAYLDADYKYAVVSGGTLSYLWFLSRTPQVTGEQMEKMLSVAKQLGYDTSMLIYPQQKDPLENITGE